MGDLRAQTLGQEHAAKLALVRDHHRRTSRLAGDLRAQEIKARHTAEVEALESIYMEQFTVTNKAPLSYEVQLTPDMEENHVGVTLVCDIPAAYPEVEPAITVRVDKGLGQKHVA